MKLSDVLLKNYKISEYYDDVLKQCYCKYNNNIIVDYQNLKYCKSSAPLFYVISNKEFYLWKSLEMED